MSLASAEKPLTPQQEYERCEEIRKVFLAVRFALDVMPPSPAEAVYIMYDAATTKDKTPRKDPVCPKPEEKTANEAPAPKETAAQAPAKAPAKQNVASKKKAPVKNESAKPRISEREWRAVREARPSTRDAGRTDLATGRTANVG